MSTIDPKDIFGILAHPESWDGRPTYGLAIPGGYGPYPEQLMDGIAYVISDNSILLYFNPLSTTPDEGVKVRTGSAVSSVYIQNMEESASSGTSIYPIEIEDGNGNIIGFEPVEFILDKRHGYIVSAHTSLIDLPGNDAPSSVWSNPYLIADPDLFPVEVPPDPEESEDKTLEVDASPLRDALKKLLLEELRADEGWDRYADFLLSQMDMSFLRFGATRGVPYDFQLNKWAQLAAAAENTRDFPIAVIDDGATVIYPNPACPARLDFDTVEVLFGPMVSHVEIDLGNGEVNTVTFPMDVSSETPRTVPTPVTISGAGSFKAHLLTEEGAPTLEECPLFRLAELPEYANPVAIQQHRIENFELLERNNPPITPAKLFAQIRALGDFRFYIAFKTMDGYGSRTTFYDDYAHVLKQEELLDARSANYWNLVFGSKLPLDALRDSIGAGASASDIIGYDKGFLVSRTSILETPLYLLQGANTSKLPTTGSVEVSPLSIELDQRGAGQKLHVLSTGSGFTTDLSETQQETYEDMLLGWKDADGSIILLTNPVNYLRKNSTGITKNYDMLSYPAGPIESIDIFIEALESQLRSQYGTKRYQQLMDAMQAVLKAATPAWADSSISFVYPQVSSRIEVTDEWVGNQQEILVNGKTTNTAPNGVEIEINQRGDAAAIRIMTRPAVIAYEVKEK